MLAGTLATSLYSLHVVCVVSTEGLPGTKAAVLCEGGRYKVYAIRRYYEKYYFCQSYEDFRVVQASL